MNMKIIHVKLKTFKEDSQFKIERTGRQPHAQISGCLLRLLAQKNVSSSLCTSVRSTRLT